MGCPCQSLRIQRSDGVVTFCVSLGPFVGTVMLIEVRRAIAEDISRVLKFYAGRRYGGGIRPEDALLLAEHDGELIGIVRLTTEESWLCCAECRFTRAFNARESGKDSWRLSPKSWMAKAASASRMRILSVSIAESDST